MLVLTLYLLFASSLVKSLMEKTSTFYKDVRFWLVVASLVTLAVMTLKSYPAG